MSSFKKLRLDPENQAQVNHRNSSNPGASGRDSIGRGMYEDLSFSSSSTSTGNYGGNANSRSAGPFRTRYSRPLDIPSPSSSSFSRFAPYYFGRERRSSLRVPLIRARRDESDQEGIRPSSRASLNSSIGSDTASSATSSTAQRIIETLQNLSTPVLNAGKIRIDQEIKAVQPMAFGAGSINPLLRTSSGAFVNRSTGPPKMCSSLLLPNPSPANQISPITGDQRRYFIPKMVDAATNTDKEVEVTVSSPQMHIVGKRGPELKTSSSAINNVSETTVSATTKVAATSAHTKDDNSDDEFHECSSEFTFSHAWSAETLERYFCTDKEDKSTTKTDAMTCSQPPLLNGYKDGNSLANALSKPQTQPSSSTSVSSLPLVSPATSSTTTTTTSLTPKSISGVPGSSLTSQSSGSGTFSFGTSSFKDATSQQKQGAITSVGEKSSSFKLASSGGSGTFGSSPSLSKQVKDATASSSDFKFGGSSSPASAIPKADVVKPFSFGKDSSKYDAGLSSTSFSAPTDKVDAAGKSESMSKTSSETPNPLTKISPPPLTVKNTGNKWRCPACMVENELVAQACVCCSEKNPNQLATSSPAAKPTVKKWRCPTCMVENAVDASACVCCSEKNPNQILVSKKWPCPTCMVENELLAPACVCCSEKNPNGVKDKLSNSSEPSSTFKFGVSSSIIPSNTSSSSSFTFGQPASTEAQKSTPTSFKFGVQTTSSVTPTVSSNTSQLNAANTTFKFGANSAATTQSPPPPSFSLPSSTPTITTASVSQPSSINTVTNSNSIFGKPVMESSGVSSTPAATSSSIFGSTSFQSPPASQPVSNSGFTFGSGLASSNDSQKQTSNFNFGASANNKPAFNAFSFGNSSQPSPSSANPSMLAPSAATPALGTSANFSFGSTSTPTASPFGQVSMSNTAPPTVQSPSSNMFQFGGAAPSNPLSAPTSISNPGFNMMPNLNFGAATPGTTIPFGNPTQPTPSAGSQPPQQLFQFSATSNESPGGRKFKKAVRRFNK